MNTADEEAQMERDEWASREVMPITNWGRRPDGSEIVQYDAPMFFSFTEHSLLHQYPHMRAECHWHVDLELTYIIHGHMWYFVNGETVRLDEGQAIFVNSRQLHYGFTKDGSDCEFSCTLLNPAKMCASFEVYDRFIAPLWRRTRCHMPSSPTTRPPVGGCLPPSDSFMRRNSVRWSGQSGQPNRCPPTI